MSPSQQDGRKLDNLVILVPSSPRITSVLRILCDQCLGVYRGRSGGPVGHQPSVPIGVPERLMDLCSQGPLGPRDSPAGTVSLKRQEIFSLRPSKGLCACSPHKSFSEIWTLPVEYYEERVHLNLSLPLLPRSVGKILSWGRLPTFKVAALNSLLPLSSLD